MAIADSSYCYILPKPFFRPTTKLKGRQPLPETYPGHLRLQTLCTYHLTTVAIADSSYCFILPNPFLCRTTKLKGRQPLPGTDRGHLGLQTPCTYHLTTVAIADKFLLFYSAYSFSPPYNEAKRAPATGRDPFFRPTTKLKGRQPLAGTDPGQLRLQTPCTYYFTPLAIGDSSYFFIQGPFSSLQ